MAVSREHGGQALECRHPVERRKEGRQRVVDRGRAGDVGGDRREDVVARKQDAIGRVPQTEVVDGVTGGVHGKPLTAGEVQRIAVGDADRRLRRQEPLSACVGLDHPDDGVIGWRLSAGAPRRLTELLEAFLPEIDDLRFGHVRDQRLQVVVSFSGERGERFVGQDVGAGDLAQLGAAAEVVGVGVGDDHCVHPLDGNLGVLQPGHERAP